MKPDPLEVEDTADPNEWGQPRRVPSSLDARHSWLADRWFSLLVYRPHSVGLVLWPLLEVSGCLRESECVTALQCLVQSSASVVRFIPVSVWFGFSLSFVIQWGKIRAYLSKGPGAQPLVIHGTRLERCPKAAFREHLATVSRR